MKIWDSESGSAPHDIDKDCMYVAIDEKNGVLRLYDSESGHRTTSMLFVGPDADKNSASFAAFARLDDEVEINTEPVASIRACFGPPA